MNIKYEKIKEISEITKALISDCGWLIEQLEKIKDLKHHNSENKKRLDENSFLERRLNDFISQLEKKQANSRESLKRTQTYLKQANEWNENSKEIN